MLLCLIYCTDTYELGFIKNVCLTTYSCGHFYLERKLKTLEYLCLFVAQSNSVGFILDVYILKYL